MEKKRYNTYLDQVLNFLEALQHPNKQLRALKYSDYQHLRSSIDMVIMELRFLKMFLWGLDYREDLEYDWHLRCFINTVLPKLTHVAKEFEADCRHTDDQSQGNWELAIYSFEKTIDQVKAQVTIICTLLLDGDFKCSSCPPNQKLFFEYGRDNAHFCDFLIWNMDALLNSSFDRVARVMKQQIVSIQRELWEFGTFVDPVNRWSDHISCVRTWYGGISCLTYLYWVNGNHESLASSMETILSGMLNKTLPNIIPAVISSYVPNFTTSYFDLLLEDLVMPMKMDIEILREGLIFLLSFIMTPPYDDSLDGRKVWVEIFHVINKFPSLIRLIHYGEIERGFSDFLLKIGKVKAKVEKMYFVVPYSSQFSSPNSNAVGFLDFLIRNLKKMIDGDVALIPTLKHQGELVQKELVSLRPILIEIMDPQNDQDEKIKDFRAKTINTVYNVDYIMKFCPARSFSVWFGIIGLSNIIKDISTIMNEFKNIAVYKEDRKMNIGVCNEMGEVDVLPPSQAANSNVEGILVGFEKEERKIVDELTKGHEHLTVISISALPGKNAIATVSGSLFQRFLPFPTPV